jgi:hypothetical protein
VTETGTSAAGDGDTPHEPAPDSPAEPSTDAPAESSSEEMPTEASSETEDPVVDLPKVEFD